MRKPSVNEWEELIVPASLLDKKELISLPISRSGVTSAKKGFVHVSVDLERYMPASMNRGLYHDHGRNTPDG